MKHTVNTRELETDVRRAERLQVEHKDRVKQILGLLDPRPFEVRRIELLNGDVFDAAFDRRSETSVVVEADQRTTMRVCKGDDGIWSASVYGTRNIYCDKDPAKAFADCCIAEWQEVRQQARN